MIRTRVSIEIDRPVEEVFRYVADPANRPAWVNEALSSALLAEGPIKVGSVFVEEIAVGLSRRIHPEFEVTRYAANRAFAFRSLTGVFPVAGVYTFEALGDRTRVTYVEESHPPGFRFKILAPLIGFAIRRRLRSDLKSLRQRLER